MTMKTTNTFSPLLLLLPLLVVVSLWWEAASCARPPTCNNQCCRFVEGFPARLRKLRQDFSYIRDFYEANDDLEATLFDRSIEDSLQTPYGCHAMKSVIDFYLKTVLPEAIANVTEENKEYKPYMESIRMIFDQLKGDIVRCMEGKGLFKAVGELDLLFNFIETYLASQRRRQ
ncbi:hypothetical protein CRUP_023411 [Coryphaenoides rupestris]|nr:hypothetical protein CRUP_023411 [Coryphaenoides rupestris]